MRKYAIIFAALALIASCTSLKEEFEPVFTSEYESPSKKEPVSMTANTTIAELARLYTTPGKPVEIGKDVKKQIIIKGKVSTTDQPGNFYKSLYIQDETGGIELKIGKNGLYNDYKPGQTLYVDCDGLTVGMYGYKARSGNYNGNGMVQIGYEDQSGDYETAYLEASYLIDTHIFKGEQGDQVVPEVITESQLPDWNDTQATNKYIGRLVTLKGLKYANEVFALLYIDSNQDKQSSSNRIFLSDTSWGITTWAMSKSKMKSYLTSGIWDSCAIGNSGSTSGVVRDYKGDGSYPGIEKAAYSVSQYFKMGDTEIQIRTSGYSKFADTEIDPDVLAGKKTIDATGILTLYQGSIQFIVNSIDDIK